ncbi:MAG: hypothetical protein R3D51_06875 [Hyphomicrobiaceae bacterium]
MSQPTCRAKAKSGEEPTVMTVYGLKNTCAHKSSKNGMRQTEISVAGVDMNNIRRTQQPEVGKDRLSSKVGNPRLGGSRFIK